MLRSKFRLNDNPIIKLLKKFQKQEQLGIQGYYLWELFRDNKLIEQVSGHNLIVDVGRNAILNIMFCGATQLTQWYAGLISDSGYTGIAAADTMASHAGWTEFTDYSGNRPEWAPEDSSGEILINATPIEYTFTDAGTIKGYFLNSVNTIGGTLGTLWSAALFDSDRTVAISDVARLTLSIEF